MNIFGPVPSRRLGQSIGINNIPPKTCTYSCVYCQIGRTDKMSVRRREFFSPDELCRQMEAKMKKLEQSNRSVDYCTFVPDGEPTLDICLGKEIGLLKRFGVKITVITNASLLWMEDVREDLAKADWVSLKVDAADQETWRRLDRPHGHLHIDTVLSGMLDFSKEYHGTLVTETMLVGGLNDGAACLEGIANHLNGLKPEKAYVLIPTRPPAEMGVHGPGLASVRNALEILRRYGGIPSGKSAFAACSWNGGLRPKSYETSLTKDWLPFESSTA